MGDVTEQEINDLSRLFRAAVGCFEVTSDEQERIREFAARTAEQNIAGISTENIRAERRSLQLRHEIVRLMRLKKEIRKTYPHRIYCDDDDTSDILLRELVDRARSSTTKKKTDSDVAADATELACTDRSHMRMLESACPLLCAPGSKYRTTLAKRLLEPGVEFPVVYFEVEVLSMVEEGILDANTASAIVSKVLMQPDRLRQLLADIARSPDAAPAPVAAPAPAPAIINSQLSFQEYFTKREEVRLKVQAYKETAAETTTDQMNHRKKTKKPKKTKKTEQSDSEYVVV